MTLGYIGNFVLQWFLIKIVTGQMPATKYIQMGNMGPVRPTVPNIPNVPMPYSTNPISTLINNYLPNLPYSNLPIPFNLPNVPSPMMPMSPSQMNIPVPLPFSNTPPVMPVSSVNSLSLPPNLKPSSPTNFIDPTVMNNLAIALHLLILNNLLHPEQESSKTSPVESQTPASPVYTQNPPKETTATVSPYPQSYYQEPQETPPIPPYAPPNSKFLSSSGFVEPSLPSLISPMPSSPRTHHSLMSPYEVIATGPPGKDVFAQYGPQNYKADFQSPYNSLTNDNTSKDLFSMF
ncbi:proline-rich receptor-like protein kinase PERK10 [Leguminivora glycinivorella]|uniref:proline-rich receptor-like protein kinase PERK10 n=1 Tax=Leguminivora glycinivorella TaxID=1035111 RepID=UPI00200DD2B2|nr:proline-rich receptor-like protein kinase PERK10 [Leguminivora glycinivorella]